jgi:hypothetical protein
LPTASRRWANLRALTSCCSNGELLQAFAGLHVVAFEDGFEPEPARYVQRIVAVNAAPAPTTPPRYGLQGPAS